MRDVTWGWNDDVIVFSHRAPLYVTTFAPLLSDASARGSVTAEARGEERIVIKREKGMYRMNSGTRKEDRERERDATHKAHTRRVLPSSIATTAARPPFMHHPMYPARPSSPPPRSLASPRPSFIFRTRCTRGRAEASAQPGAAPI